MTSDVENIINWTGAGGAQYDGLMLGDSNTSLIRDFTVEPWPKKPKRVMAAGLPGNGILNVAYAASMNNWLSLFKPKFVILYIGINDCLFANQASWLTPAAWAAAYQALAQSVINAGAVVVCASYHMPGVSASGLISAALLALYNTQVRTTVHDALYYANPGKFIYVEVSGSLMNPLTGLTPSSYLLPDDEHWTQLTATKTVRRYFEDALAVLAPF